MRRFVVASLFIFTATQIQAADYIKDGKLTGTLTVKEVQGGFAGFTGKQYTISPDGKWEEFSVFKQTTKSLSKGTLTKKQLEDLAAELKKYDPATLKNSGKVTGANPRVVSVSFDKTTASLTLTTGADLPAKSDKDIPGRVAGVVAAVKAALKKK